MKMNYYTKVNMDSVLYHPTENCITRDFRRNYQSLIGGKLPIGIFLDFFSLFKVFDNLDHKIFLEKLKHYEIKVT